MSTERMKSRQSGKDKGLLIGKEAICRLLPMNAKQLTRLIEEGKDSPLMRLIRRMPETGTIWAWKREIEAYRDNNPIIVDARARSRRRKAPTQ